MSLDLDDYIIFTLTFQSVTNTNKTYCTTLTSRESDEISKVLTVLQATSSPQKSVFFLRKLQAPVLISFLVRICVVFDN